MARRIRRRFPLVAGGFMIALIVSAGLAHAQALSQQVTVNIAATPGDFMRRPSGRGRRAVRIKPANAPQAAKRSR